jgi:small-conductance mechanosensitive channel
VFFGVLVSVGSSGAVADVVSGIVLTYTRAFHMGDRVRIADAEGDVLEKTLFVTRVRTTKNVDITIPNALVMSNHIINFSAQARRGGLILHTTVTIGYDVLPARVCELLIAAARETESILDTPEPFVSQTALGDFYVHYELNAHTKDAKRMGITYSDLHRAILDKFNEAGVEIASPHLSSVRDGNQTQLPDDYLPKDYKPAAFRILPLRAFRSDGGTGSGG